MGVPAKKGRYDGFTNVKTSTVFITNMEIEIKSIETFIRNIDKEI